MKAVLFCVNAYAFGILKPLADELQRAGNDTWWFVADKLVDSFPFKNEARYSNSIQDLIDYKSDALFVPGNEVPHFVRGVKVQVFHGLAGEKKGHFRIRTYFDLYLTQGPYFTKRFQEFAAEYKDFEVQETGWCKLDPLFEGVAEARKERDALLHEKGKKHLVLYAPTFSPSLTSAIKCKSAIFSLADSDIHLLIKFHDLMDTETVNAYRTFAETRDNVEIVEDRNILRVLKMADLMISDTSSVVYEFVLLDRPVITIDSISENINWLNISAADNLLDAVKHELENDSYAATRKEIVRSYHPYTDGKSSARMIKATEDYIARNGVPETRKLSLYRRFLMDRMFKVEKAK